MKKPFLLFLIAPLVFSCSSFSPISKDEAKEAIKQIQNKYNDLKNVELDLIIDTRINGIVLQCAYDSENNYFYQYTNATGIYYKIWHYFQNDTHITLNEYHDEKGNVVKIKKVVPSEPTKPYTGKEYFQNEFRIIIYEAINHMNNVIDSYDKTKEQYLKNGNFYQININNTTDEFKYTFYKDRLDAITVKNINSKNKNTYNFCYDRFVTSVNPSDFVEG